MKNILRKIKKDPTVIILSLIIMLLAIIPTGFEQLIQGNSERVKAEVIDADNSLIRIHGIVKTGAQELKLKIVNSRFKDTEVKAYNQLIGKMELDKMFRKGDRALVVLDLKDNKIIHANVIDHYRIDTEAFLFILFFLLVIAVAGGTGFRSMLTFMFTALFIWKILLPSFMRGWPPVPVSLIAVFILTSVIIFSIAGVTRKGMSAFLGAVAGIAITCVLSVGFSYLFKIHGAVRPFSEALLYTGFPYMNLTGIFLSGIFIASSGAVMDVAMDISAAVNEITEKKPDIEFIELFRSGLEVGKAVIGTMTTTLLLAYSGGYSAMFMLFIAQGTPLINILNVQYVSAEILHTLVGSFGLVSVAPLTAFISAMIFTRKREYEIQAESNTVIVDNLTT